MTNNKGDLISREALKTALANNTLIRDFNLQFDGIIGEIIDNAPTVEYPFYQEAYQTGYEEGYAQGYIDGSTGADWRGDAE